MNKDVDLIREKLAEFRLTHVWMIQQLHEAGVHTDKTEFSSVLARTRGGPKAQLIISTALSILSKYEEAMRQV